MINQLFYSGYFDYKKYIKDNIKELDINIEQAYVLEYIVELVLSGKHKIDIKFLSQAINRDKKYIQDNILSILIEKKLFKYISNPSKKNNEDISIEEFLNRAEEYINNKYSNEIMAKLDDKSLFRNYFIENIKDYNSFKDDETIDFIYNNGYKLSDIKDSVFRLNNLGYTVTIKNIIGFLPNSSNFQNNKELEDIKKRLKLSEEY